MDQNERQLERVARRLDGESVELDERGGRFERQFTRDEQRIAGQLDVAMPPEVTARIEARIAAELQRRRPRVLRMVGAGAAWAAAAAAVVLLVTLTATDRSIDITRPTVSAAQAVPLAVLMEANEKSVETVDLELFETELGRLAMDMSGSTQASSFMDTRIDLLQSDLEEFWLHDAGAEYLEL